MNSLLNVNDLTIQFNQQQPVVNHISFNVNKREIVCIVGESGSGKSLSVSSLLNILPNDASVSSGNAIFKGIDLIKLNEKQLDNIRGNDISIIFQDPLSSLNPLFTIGNQMDETVFAHNKISKKEAKEKSLRMLESVGLSDSALIYRSYPHTLSGGMRQRVCIAMALINNPSLLIADEPTTALDVTIQAQIMDLIRKKKQEMDMSVLLITHDMGVVASLADRVYVMYQGKIVESGYCDVILKNPYHPYTQDLIASISQLNHRTIQRNHHLDQNNQNISGCGYALRCDHPSDKCIYEVCMKEVEKDHFVLCNQYGN